MDISVIICTYNRSYHLKNVLKSLFEQVVPEGLKWEIVVVDNNSTDDTKNTVKQLTDSLNLSIEYLFESREGKSYALNTGIQKAKGQIIAFTDDDVIVDRNWIKTIYHSFKQNGCDGLCGKIYITLPEKKPHWLTKELWGFLGYLDYGDKPFFITNEDIFGGNVAYSRKTIERTGLFNVNLGRTGNKLIGKEDVEYGKRVIEQGRKLLYEPALKVFHKIEPWKFKRGYFLKLHYYEGKLSAKQYDKSINRTIFGIPLFIFPQFLRSIMKYFRNPTLRMQMNIWWFLGFMKGRIIEYKKLH